LRDNLTDRPSLELSYWSRKVRRSRRIRVRLLSFLRPPRVGWIIVTVAVGMELYLLAGKLP
jgi:hypothetical protein